MSSSIDFLLLGQSGSGKSSTGNSILRQKVFNANSSSSLSFDNFAIRSGEYRNYKVTVMDGLNIEESIRRRDFKNIDEVMERGFSSLLIVIKYGERVTKEVCDVVQAAKFVFGNNVLKNHGILVLSSGDTFRKDMKHIDIKQWLQKQEAEMKEIYEECNKRCILFDNRTTNSEKKDEQINLLLELVRAANIKKYYLKDNSYKRKISTQIKIEELKEETDHIIKKVREKIENTKGDKINILHQTLEELQHQKEKVKTALGEDYDEKIDFIFSVETVMKEIENSMRCLESTVSPRYKYEKEPDFPINNKREDERAILFKKLTEINAEIRRNNERKDKILEQLFQL